jgi:hypothetical protein
LLHVCFSKRSDLQFTTRCRVIKLPLITELSIRIFPTKLDFRQNVHFFNWYNNIIRNFLFARVRLTLVSKNNFQWPILNAKDAKRLCTQLNKLKLLMLSGITN